jgi:predicted  nucleic acid-binding Zn-ribbon protein
MSDPTIAAWSRENDLLFQLRQLREENERLKKEITNQDAMLERQTARIVDLQTHIENFDGEDR